MVTQSTCLTMKGVGDGDSHKVSDDLRRKESITVKVVYRQNGVQVPRTPKANGRKGKRKYFPNRQTENVMVMTGMASASRRKAMPR